MESIETINLDHLVGRQLGTSVLLKEIGRGGMAVIFAAYQKTLKRRIAVKILPKSCITPSKAELFQHEAESVAILSHPNIVPVYEIGEAEDFLYFTMQLVNGKALSYYIAQLRKHPVPSKRAIPLRTTIKMATSILDGLNYAHEQGIIHRDVKPSNIIIEKHSKRPIITDFGIARANREPHGKAKVISGTPIYIAPEQLLNTALDHRMDIYSVGVTLFEMLVSDLPLPQFTSLRELFQLKLELKEKFFRKKPSELNPNIDREMDDIIYKALAHRPGDRYATCAEFLKRLENYGHRAN